MTKSAEKILILAFILFLGGAMLLNLLTPDRAYSLRENRYLAKRPRFDVQNILKGRFSRQFEEYITDQFAFRDQWVLLKGDLEMLLLRRENNGIFFGRDGYLLEDFPPPGPALARNLDRINAFAQAFPHLKIHLLLTPNSVAIYPDKLPPFARVQDQAEVLERVKGELATGIEFIPVLTALQAEREQYIYFRTDHHWTVRGAYLAYRQLAAALGFQPLVPQDFESKEVAQDFWGTYYSKANNRYLKGDEIEVWLPKKPAQVEVRFNDREGSFSSLYFPHHLETRDKYAYFLDGNHPLAVISTDRAQGGKLAVIKDSFAHALLPFLAQHYQEIHVIDLRFFDADLGQYLEEQGIQQALFLYNLSSFASDSTLVNFR
ncbi:MAG: DHHW family protein [Bacillota bacterium]|jgi:hypothetical protein